MPASEPPISIAQTLPPNIDRTRFTSRLLC